MANFCQITGKRPLVGNHVSFSAKKTKRRYLPNLQVKRFYVPEEGRYVKLKVSRKGLKMIDKKGVGPCIQEAREKGYLK